LLFVVIREHEDLAAALGIKGKGRNLTAFVMSWDLQEILGFAFGHVVDFSDAESSFKTGPSCSAVIMVVLCGLGTRRKCVVGAVSLRVVREFVGGIEEYCLAIYRYVLLLVIVFPAQGLMVVKRMDEIIGQPDQ
jgi:ABC-type branched-subunit amino acid transport system permease subunit